MPTPIIVSEGVFEKSPSHVVSIKLHWSDPWTPVPYLYATKFAQRASPETSTAELTYKYGNIMRPDQVDYVVYDPLAIRGWYVQIVVNLVNEDGEPTPITWTGTVGDEGGTREGPLILDDERVPTGRQTWACFGLELLLAREPIRKSTAQTAAGGEEELGRAIGFNVPLGRANDDFTGNRSEDVGDEGTYLFASSLAAAVFWDASSIVPYLLAYRTPRDIAGVCNPPFEVAPASLPLLPDWDQPRLKIHSESVRDVLDNLLSRKRLVSWYLDVAGGVPTVNVFSFTPVNISVGFGFTLQANAQQVTVDFDEDVLVREAVVKKTQDDLYDQVICRGDRKGSCFTICFADGTLEADWASSLAAEYETAASAQVDYGPGTNEKQQRNRLWRSADRYKRVYSDFRVPLAWDGETGDGTGADFAPVFPVDDLLDESDTFWRPGLLFASALPLMTDHDYSGNKIATNAVTDNTPAGSTAERLKPMLFIQTPQLITAGRQWQHGEKPQVLTNYDKHALGGAVFRTSVRMQDRGLGISVRVEGAPQHAIASVDFTPVDYTDSPGVIDWHTSLCATVYCQSDHYVEARWPEEPPDDPALGDDPATDESDVDTVLTSVDYVRTLEIDFGDSAKLDYVAPNTVVGIKDGILQRSTGGYVRDDRSRLFFAAQVAYEWYSQERQAIVLSYKTLTNQFTIGMLVVAIGAGTTLEAVNTPVTSIEWDLLAGTTTVQTGFASLDLLQFSGAVGAPPMVAGLGAG